MTEPIPPQREPGAVGAARPDGASSLPVGESRPTGQGVAAPPALPAGQGAQGVRKAERITQGAWIAGVSTGISEHLGWPLWLVRVGFFLLAQVQLIGVFVYGLLWVLMPQRKKQQAPGLEAAERQGMRDASERPARSRDVQSVAGLALAAGAGLLLVQGNFLGLSGSLLVPLAFAGAGVALVWHQADQSQQGPSPSVATGNRWLRPFLAQQGTAAVTRLVLGVGLVGISVSMVAASQFGLAGLPRVLGISGLMVLGLVIAAAPWIHGLQQRLQAAHEQQLVDSARADMAAHLHDSVLQTLALIQRQSDDAKAVASLARRQERELRTWLYGDVPTEATLKSALVAQTAEVEDDTGIEVECVFVGDAELTPPLEALVAAAREAVMNAAKHSGATRVDVFGEIEDGVVEVFVRDRGRGFDMASIADDRMGVRRSILERMERHGGTARVRTAPGEGTEIRLQMSIERRA